MIVTWGVCLLLVVATIGEGGAAPLSLLVQHAVLCAILILVLVRPRGAPRRLDPAFGACFGAFAALALAGALLAPYAYAAFLVLLEIAVFFAVAALAAEAGRDLLPVLGAGIGAAAVAQSLAALVQRVSGAALRPAGGFLNPNHFAAWLAAALFVMWGVALARGRRARLAAGIATVPILAATFLVGSRGAVLGLAAGGATALACAARSSDRRASRRIGAAALAILAIGAAGVAVRFRVADPLGASRPRIWRASAQALIENPWFGTKPGQFETLAANLNFSRDQGPLRFEHVFSTPHSDVLRALVEFGVPAAAALAAAIALSLRSVVRRARASTLGPAGIGALAAVAALAAQTLVNDLTEIPALYLLGAALVGSLLAVDVEIPRDARGAFQPPFRFGAAALLVVFLICADVGPYFSWSIQTGLPRGALAPMEREALDRARRLNPFQPDLAVRVADDLVARSATFTPDTYATAREAAEDATRLAPNAPAGWRALARVEGSACRLLFKDVATRKRAESAYLEAESRSHHDPFVPLENGLFLFSTGDLEGARRAALRALHIEPNAIPPRLLLAELALAAHGEAGRVEALGQLDEAESLALRFMSAPKESPYALRLLTVDPEIVARIRARLERSQLVPQLDAPPTED